MVVEVTEPQEGWKRCPKCERDGFRPPWQGYCYDCQRTYQRDLRLKKKRERLAFERTLEKQKYHDQIKYLAMAQGIDPETVEYPDPPWWSEES